MIEVNYFLVRFDGDRTVGIFPAEWEITGDFYFEDNAQLEVFKSKLTEAWAYCSDTPVYVFTDKELDAQENDLNHIL